jgi:hypothetical protein
MSTEEKTGTVVENADALLESVFGTSIPKVEEPTEDNKVEEVEEVEDSKDTEDNEDTEEVVEGTTEEAPEEEEEELPASVSIMLDLFTSGGYGSEDDLGQLLEESGIDPEAETALTDMLNAVIDKKSQPQYANDEARNFDNYLKQGGNPRDYFEQLYNQPDYTTIDPYNLSEQQQEAVLRASLHNKGLDNELIEGLIEQAKEKETLESSFLKAFDEIKNQQLYQKEMFAQQLEENQKAQRQQIQETVSQVTNFVNESNEIGGLPISKKEKKKFLSYFLDADKEGMTSFQRVSAEQGIDFWLKVAFLAFKNPEMNIGSITSKEAETKQASKLKSYLQNTRDKKAKSGGRKKSKSKTNTENGLLDIFK